MHAHSFINLNLVLRMAFSAFVRIYTFSMNSMHSFIYKAIESKQGLNHGISNVSSRCPGCVNTGTWRCPPLIGSLMTDAATVSEQALTLPNVKLP